MNPRRRLHELVERKQGLVVPGAYDCVSARLIERAGFQAVYGLGSPVITDTDAWLDVLDSWLSRYPIASIEDPVAEDDAARAVAQVLGRQHIVLAALDQMNACRGRHVFVRDLVHAPRHFER